MSSIADKIYQEVRQLPEQLARKVYNFLIFVEARHGINISADEPVPSVTSSWKEFFDRQAAPWTTRSP